MQQDSNESDWLWKLSVERRLILHGEKIRQLGAKTMAPKDSPPRWTPRDFLTAGAGIAMVIAALSEKVGWTTAIGGLVKLYGGK